MRKSAEPTDGIMESNPRELSGLLAKQGELIYYQFPNLSGFPEIRHAVFTRRSGYSKPPFDSLNVALNVGDDPQNVTKNRNTIARCMEMDELVFVDQVHGADVVCMKKDATAAAPPKQQEGDALITDIPGKLIAVQTADCQAVFLYEPSRKVVAVVHSGWRGSIQNIIGRTIQRMNDDYGCTAEKIVGGVGPSLGPCCSEFIHYKTEIPEAFWKYKTGNNHFNFWAISCDQLTKAGVLPENVHISGLCTRCRTDYFYSFRGQRKTGRFAGVIGLKTP